MEVPGKSMSCQEIYGLQDHVFLEPWGIKPQGLSQGDVVHIEYFHIEILIYFHKMKTISVPWPKETIF